jgi:hypothetical protein
LGIRVKVEGGGDTGQSLGSVDLGEWPPRFRAGAFGGDGAFDGVGRTSGGGSETGATCASNRVNPGDDLDLFPVEDGATPLTPEEQLEFIPSLAIRAQLSFEVQTWLQARPGGGG